MHQKGEAKSGDKGEATKGKGGGEREPRVAQERPSGSKGRVKGRTEGREGKGEAKEDGLG